MQFETLTENHLFQLLNFELGNKQWFESVVEPRAADFYSENAVAKHIQTQVKNMNAGLAYSGVLVKNNVIVGRGNLKSICDGKALVGYRISEKHTSQGFASYCLSGLIDVAKEKFDITVLEAEILDNNPASRKVLEKKDFAEVDYIPKFLTVNGIEYGCAKFQRKLIMS